MQKKPLSRRAVVALQLFIATIGVAALLCIPHALESGRRAHAQEAPPQKEFIKLPWGQKLESVSWACHPAGYCEPWILYRPLRGDEIPTNYRFTNKDGTRIFVISESRIPH